MNLPQCKIVAVIVVTTWAGCSVAQSIGAHNEQGPSLRDCMSRESDVRLSYGAHIPAWYLLGRWRGLADLVEEKRKRSVEAIVVPVRNVTASQNGEACTINDVEAVIAITRAIAAGSGVARSMLIHYDGAAEEMTAVMTRSLRGPMFDRRGESTPAFTWRCKIRDDDLFTGPSDNTKLTIRRVKTASAYLRAYLELWGEERHGQFDSIARECGFDGAMEDLRKIWRIDDRVYVKRKDWSIDMSRSDVPVPSSEILKNLDAVLDRKLCGIENPDSVEAQVLRLSQSLRDTAATGDQSSKANVRAREVGLFVQLAVEAWTHPTPGVRTLPNMKSLLIESVEDEPNVFSRLLTLGRTMDEVWSALVADDNRLLRRWPFTQGVTEALAATERALEAQRAGRPLPDECRVLLETSTMEAIAVFDGPRGRELLNAPCGKLRIGGWGLVDVANTRKSPFLYLEMMNEGGAWLRLDESALPSAK